MTISLLVDSPSDLPDDIVRKFKIKVVPAIIRFGRQTFMDRVDLTVDEFYEKLMTNPYHPRTFAAPPTIMYDAFEELAAKSDEILAMFISRKTSKFYDTAVRTAELFHKCPVHVYDTESVSVGAALQELYAAEALQKGYTIPQIIARLNQMKNNQSLYVQLETMVYLERGGRLSPSKRIVGSLLRIKPLIQVKDGEVQEFKRTFNKKKGIDIMINELKVKYSDDPVMISVGHIYAREEANELVKRAQEELNVVRIVLVKIGSSVGTHIGPGSFGISAVPFIDY